ncbi:hypothetical protein D3C77_272310 [compost metagenome]
MGTEQFGFVSHLCLGDAADQMGTYVVRLGQWRVVGITADVEVVVVSFERGIVDDG